VSIFSVFSQAPHKIFQKKNGKKESTKSSARSRIRSAISPEGRQGRYAHAGACGCYFRGSFNPFSLEISQSVLQQAESISDARFWNGIEIFRKFKLKKNTAMEKQYDLDRFLEAQRETYANALEEIRKGRKQTHWMWFIFPQLRGLGFTDYNIFYGIENLEEASLYLNHPILGKRLVEVTSAMLKIENKTALEILGRPDERKLKSCMTLFSLLPDAPDCFVQVLEKYYNGEQDENTLRILKALTGE